MQRVTFSLNENVVLVWLDFSHTSSSFPQNNQNFSPGWLGGTTVPNITQTSVGNNPHTVDTWSWKPSTDFLANNNSRRDTNPQTGVTGSCRDDYNLMADNTAVKCRDLDRPAGLAHLLLLLLRHIRLHDHPPSSTGASGAFKRQLQMRNMISVSWTLLDYGT
jgi:hypothetical protein